MGELSSKPLLTCMQTTDAKPDQEKELIASMQIMREKKGETCIGTKGEKAMKNSMQLKRRLRNLGMVAIEARHH